MGFSKLSSAQLDGLEAHIVTIETDITRGLNSFNLVGLPDKAVEESRDRVSSAIKNSDLRSYKQKNERVVISLAPAELKKTGPIFDLGIALGYLLASGDVDFDPKGRIFLGELSLDGHIRPINGVLSIAQAAKNEGLLEVFVPRENAREAALVEGIKVYALSTLSEVISHLDPSGNMKRYENKKGDKAKKSSAQAFISLLPEPSTKLKSEPEKRSDRIRLDDIRGQAAAKRALEIASAGAHNILLFGPPGTGKTLLAKAFSSLLPDLSLDEALEVTAIHSAAGTLKEAFITRPPFRAPHHTSSYVSIVGGGAYPRPGEMTLAHRGVLFLDEFPEFDRRVIESLREPLEERFLTVSRSQKTAIFPANIILIAAMNPCPCGNHGSSKECRCTPGDLARYERKLSGPILDRIDLWVEVGRIETKELRVTKEKEDGNKEEVAATKRIAEAQARQRKRLERTGKTRNSHLGPREITKYVNATEDVYELIENAVDELDLSARGYHKILKVARTIADLDGSEQVREEHLLEALQYRQKRIFL